MSGGFVMSSGESGEEGRGERCVIMNRKEM